MDVKKNHIIYQVSVIVQSSAMPTSGFLMVTTPLDASKKETKSIVSPPDPCEAVTRVGALAWPEISTLSTVESGL